jgi:hypothetical protein
MGHRLLRLAQAGPIQGGPCLGHMRGDLDLLHAAFRLDAERQYRDARLTRCATLFLHEGRNSLGQIERDLDRAAAMPDPNTAAVQGGAGRLPLRASRRFQARRGAASGTVSDGAPARLAARSMARESMGSPNVLEALISARTERKDRR